MANVQSIENLRSLDQDAQNKAVLEFGLQQDAYDRADDPTPVLNLLTRLTPEQKTEIKTSVELISPDIAEVYLKTQKLNRHPQQGRVVDYADRMLRGEWRISQPIQFTSDGDLFDGQHRLMAVIAAGIACEFLVVRGLPPETRYCVDIGQTRTVAQIAQLMQVGTSMCSKLATCKAMFIGRELKPKNATAKEQAKGIRASISKSFSPEKLINLYLQHRDGIDFADPMKNVATAPVRAVVARAWYHENHLRLQQFVDVISGGYPITPNDDAAIALRNYIVQTKAGKDVGASSARLIFYKKTMSALANFLIGKNVRMLKEKDIELYPMPDFD